MDDNEFEAYTRDAVRELREKIESLHTEFYVDSVARWDFDLHQVPGTLRFFDKNDNLVWICDVFEIGTFSPSTCSWKWAWSNNSLPPNAREQALPLKQLQKITGRDYFGFETPLTADMDFARQLAAIAVKHLSALGCYEARIQDSGGLYVFLAITGVRSVRRMAAGEEVRVQHDAHAQMGNRIVEMRKQRGWNQAELAQRLGWNCATVHQWESGQSGEAGLNPVLLIGLCHVLGCTLDYLYYGKGPGPDGK